MDPRWRARRAGPGAPRSPEWFAVGAPDVKARVPARGSRRGGSLTPPRAMGSFSPPMRRTATGLIVCSLAGILLPGAARAQGDEAPPPAPGVLRVMVPGVWGRWDQRFGRGTAGRVDGQLEPIGTDFGADTFGTTQLPFLGPPDSALRSVTGLGSFAINVGRTDLQLNANVRTLPIAFSLGVSRRLSIGVLVPLVRSRVEAFFRLDTAAAARGNVGANPGFSNPTAYTAFRAQVDDALAALDPFSLKRYDVFWKHKAGSLWQAKPRREGATWLEMDNAAGIVLAMPMLDGMPFTAFGDASGFGHEFTRIKEHSHTDTGGVGWVSQCWDHWPIGWLNSQASDWKPGSPYSYSFGSIGQFFIPPGKRPLIVVNFVTSAP